MALIVGAFLLLNGLGIQAQQVLGVTISELQQQIQRLMEIERNASTPHEIRVINQKLIAERRSELKLLLVKRIDALRTYLSSVSAIVTPNENQTIQESIAKLEGDLRSVESDLRAGELTQRVIAQEITNPEQTSIALTSVSNNVISDSLPSEPSFLPTKATANPQTDVEADIAFSNDEAEGDIQTLVAAVNAAPSKNPALAARQARINEFDYLRNPLLMALILTKRKERILPRAKFVQEVNEARVDKQIEGEDKNAGATSLVSKGSIPAIIGFAVENGALTKTDSGTTIT